MKQFFYIICLLFMTSCTWVKDDLDDCPDGFWLNLHYTYNILDVEAVEEYINEASVFVYDTAGNYVKRIDVPQATLAADNHRVKIEGLPFGRYQFVVWSGTTNNSFSISGPQGAMKDFRLSLVDKDISKTDLPNLYHGYLSMVEYSSSHAVHDVYLMKNTNNLACMVVTESEDVELDPEDYNMQLISANSVMDANNNLVADAATVYEPFIKDSTTIDDNGKKLHGVRFGISTLRLMDKTDCRMILSKTDTGETIFNVSLPQCVGMIGSLYTQLGKPLTVQEYLDRQDFYTVIFILSEGVDQLIQMKVNSWRVRSNNHLNL